MLDGNAEDSGQYGNHGTILGDVIPDLDRFGNVGKACLFDGGVIDAGNPKIYQLTDELSISVWLKPHFMFVWGGIVSKWQDFGVGSFYLGVNPETQLVRWNLDMPFPTEGDELIENEWIHIVATYDGTAAKLYENGELSSVRIFQEGLKNVSDHLYIGGQNYNLNGLTGLFIGSLDDVRIYDRALDVEEVEMLFLDQTTTSTSEVARAEKMTVYPNPSEGVFRIANSESAEIFYMVLILKAVSYCQAYMLIILTLVICMQASILLGLM